MPQVEFAYSNIVYDSMDAQEDVRLKIEKSDKKYKAIVEKKRREKLFEEEDMMMINLRRKRILT